MAIPRDDVQAVRAATDIVALVGEYTPLKRVGRRFTGLCPFHAEKTGSFSVNGEEGLYYCFGCQAAGDAISFLRAVEGCTFVEAVERLAGRVGIHVRDESDEKDRLARDKRGALYSAMEEAVAFYHSRLVKHPDAARARQYLRSRGLDGDAVRRFRLGWAPEGGSELVRNVKSKPDALAGAGLATQGSYGPRDSFRGRVVFPIFQTDGKAIALGGRLVPGIGDGNGPKYRNSPETAIYQKRSTLYSLNLARQEIVRTGEVIVCEGYTDVIGLFRVGLQRAVATCGTALTEEHFKLLARFGRRIVLAFDADSAGWSAAERFYEWERRHEIEVAVAELPAGSDPGELASTDPGKLRQVVAEARSYLDFRLRQSLAREDLRSPEGRARAAGAAVAVLAEHPNVLVREQYLVEVADRTRMDAERLRPQLAEAIAGRGAGHRKQAPPAAANGTMAANAARKSPPPTAGQRAGRDALALAIHLPAKMAGRLDECLFADPLQQEAYRALDSAKSLHEAIEGADDEVARLLVELANVDPEVSVGQAVVALVRARGQQGVADLEAQVRQAQASGEEERLLDKGAEVAWLKSELEIFSEVGAGENPPEQVTEAAGRLVAWLVQRGGEAT